ncbi:MAG TPA: copper transporter [Micromonosporaceae bacterium]
MINFRYHVVSLTAVFFALAIGLIVGTAALNGPAADELHNQVTQISKDNSVLRANVKSLTSEVNNKEQFATEVAPQLLAQKLTNRRVVIVSMQGSSKLVPAILDNLKLAGAKVTGQVEIEDKFVDPTNNAALIDLAEQSLNTASITGLPTNSIGSETSSALLAALLMDRSPVVAAKERDQILAAYDDKNYISVTKPVTGPAEAVLFVAPAPFEDGNASQENSYMVGIVSQFASAGPIVVGSNGASGSGNVIGSVTGDAALSRTVSTVDNVETVEGQVAAVLALNEQLIYNKTGHYGQASSATSLLPKWPEE